MFVQIGRRSEPGNAIDMLVACHGRIRHFLRVATSLATTPSSATEVQDAAQSVARYFEEAFPLHVEDEEELLIALLLRSADEHVRAACSVVTREHRDQEPLVTSLLAQCRLLTAAPERLVEVRAPLAASALALQKALEPHLAEEERVLFPALRSTLSAAELDSALVTMQRRRTVHHE
jgi:hemerythrin-like domain-containing protein